MNWRAIGTVYSKELLDAVRDRRTLISMIIMPTFLMPVLIFGMGKAASTIVSKARDEIPRIMVIGGADSPDVRAQLEKTGKFRIENASAGWKALISDKKVRAGVEIPAGFQKALESGSAPPVTIYDYRGELKSGMAADQIGDFFADLRDRTTARILSAHGLPPRIARPFEVTWTNVAPPEKVGGNMLGGIVPYIIVMLCFVGAMYPAVDITAGEKERGTMETLLCCPAARSDIVLGKFLMVLTGSLSAVTLSLISLGVTLTAFATMLPPGAGASVPGGTDIPTIDPVGMFGVLAMVLPVAVLFSATIFSVSLFAKSQKEAQSYLTPLLMAFILPSGVALLPGIELNIFLALIPVVNVALVCKEMLSGVWHWGLIGVIFGSTALYASIALAIADRMFRREDVIFRT